MAEQGFRDHGFYSPEWDPYDEVDLSHQPSAVLEAMFSSDDLVTSIPQSRKSVTWADSPLQFVTSLTSTGRSDQDLYDSLVSKPLATAGYDAVDMSGLSQPLVCEQI